MARPCVDYSPFEPNVWSWATVAEFISGEPRQGVHRIGLGAEGNSLDLQLINWDPGSLSQQGVLPVFFSAAVGSRDGKAAPFFSGAGLAAADGYAAIALSDPSLALSPNLGLAWYAGSTNAPVQALIRELLEQVARTMGKELLLVGGSGGGFAACLYASLVDARASAFVWNPQTDILKYYRSAVRDYLKTCWGTSDMDEGRARALLAAKGAVSDLASAGLGGTSRLVYIQNVSDTFHVDSHALPYLSGLEMRSVGPEGFHVSGDGRVAVLFGHWSSGHEAPPKTMVRAVIRKLMNTDASALAVGRWLAASPFANHTGGGTYPLLFGPATTLDVDACATGGAIEAHASLSGVAPTSKPHFAFYLLDHETRVDTRWYEPGASASFERCDAANGTHGIVAFSKDDFGNIIQATSPVRLSASRSLDLPATLRVFVLGSCVSRDAFAFFGQDDRLAGYVARTSLASAMRTDRPPGLPEDLSGIKSSWQRRMVGVDLRKELPMLLSGTEFDLLLLDLIDERFSIGLVDGTAFTLSPEFLSLSATPNSVTRLRPDRDARWALWCEGVEALVERVGADRIVLNQAYWATHLDDGTKLADPARAQAMNRLLRRMYAHIVGRYGIRAIDYPKQAIVGARDHRWGVSPFHYSRGFYKQTLHELGRISR